MTPRPDQLDVYFGAEHVGIVHDATPLAFAYTAPWLARAQPMAIAAIPLQPGRQDSAAVQAYFENLLPEGELRDYLAAQRKASTLFSLLLEVAGDTAGGFVILASGQTPQAPRYEPSTWEAIAAVLRKTSAAAIDLRGQGARISLAGAQDKTSLAIFIDGVPRLPRGASPSTHILKPNIKRLAKVWHSAANETIVMRTAAHCGLPTAEVFYEPHTESCVVRRFDRTSRSDGTLARLVQYDLCQLAGTVSGRKYEKEGGPDLAQCAALIRRYSTQPALDLRKFVDWILFNLFVGNNDSHAKNLSLYAAPGQGVLLTPFYDLMCTRLYPGLSPHFAFAIDGEFMPGRLTRAHVESLARQLGMQPTFFLRQAATLAIKMPDALQQAVNEVSPSLSRPAKELASKLQLFVASTTRKTAARLAR